MFTDQTKSDCVRLKFVKFLEVNGRETNSTVGEETPGGLESATVSPYTVRTVPHSFSLTNQSHRRSTCNYP